jgi:phage N-6-adenine-methyltransferase
MSQPWLPMSKQDWKTPKWLFEALSGTFGPFVLDAAASKANALCSEFFDEETNGLLQPWGAGPTWVNPPFNSMDKWVDKAIEEAHEGAKAVMLGPANVSTRWFHRALSSGATILIPDLRIAFVDTTSLRNSPDRDTIILTWGIMNPGITTIQLRQHRRTLQ